jgi:hypothetical protein
MVAPQGLTGIVNKGDMSVFHIIPQTLPHTRNKDSYPDFAAQLRWTFSDNLAGTAPDALGCCLARLRSKRGFKSPPPHQSTESSTYRKASPKTAGLLLVTVTVFVTVVENCRRLCLAIPYPVGSKIQHLVEFCILSSQN